MRDRLVRKGLVIGIIILFVGAGVVLNNTRNVCATDVSPYITKITNNYVADNEPSLYQRASGTFYLTWSSRASGNLDVWSYQSSDAINWFNKKQITTYNDMDYHPSLTEANNGNLLISYVSTQGYPWGAKTYLSRSTDGGNTWAAPVLGEPYCSGNPYLFKASNGTIYFLRHQLGSWTKVSKSTDNGYSWTLISTVENHPYIVNPEMRQYDGNLFLTCDSSQDINPNPSDIYFYKSTDGGYTWVEKSKFESSYHDYTPTFVRTNAGQYIIVWVSNNRDASGKNHLYYSTSDDFISWSTPQPLMGTPSYNDEFPCLLKDNTGKIFLAWSSDQDGDYEIYLAQFSDMITIEVSIDIKPGSFPNSINPKSNGKLPVAILTNEDFDASDVDPDSIDFLSASPLMWAMDDVDDDGDIDMILHFKIKELDFDLLVDEGGEYPYAYLYGDTLDNIPIDGKDTVRLVNNWQRNSETRNKISFNTLLQRIMQNHLNLFPILQKIIQGLGQ